MNHTIIPPCRMSVLSHQPSTDINEPDFDGSTDSPVKMTHGSLTTVLNWDHQKSASAMKQEVAPQTLWFKKPYTWSQQANNWDYLLTPSQASTKRLTIGIAYSASCTSVVKYRLRDRMDSSKCTNFGKHGTTYYLRGMKSCRLRDRCFSCQKL